jgi:Zn finger protein HypA/HybF involved in hydrogenase expression
MTPEHFRDHFALVTQGTVAEGAETEIEVNQDTTAPDAHSVRLLEITVRKP